MTDCKNALLYDLEYVRTCVEKAIEAVPEDFSAEKHMENTYYVITQEGDTVSDIAPSCLVGQILSNIGVNDELMYEIAHQYNSMGFIELVDRVKLPIDDASVAFLCEVQHLNDSHVPWHRIMEVLSEH
jgi:hypothetical protein